MYSFDRHPAGFDVRLTKPLDFYAVTDHARFLGAVREAADPSTEFSRLPHVQALHNLNAPENMNLASMPLRAAAFANFLPETLKGVATGRIDAELLNGISRTAWADIVSAAEQFNEPGAFTTFVAFEYTTSSDDRGNLHRDADKLPAMPYGMISKSGLWAWMDDLRAEGKQGTSETHPVLSVNDEWVHTDSASSAHRIRTPRRRPSRRTTTFPRSPARLVGAAARLGAARSR